MGGLEKGLLNLLKESGEASLRGHLLSRDLRMGRHLLVDMLDQHREQHVKCIEALHPIAWGPLSSPSEHTYSHTSLNHGDAF